MDKLKLLVVDDEEGIIAWVTRFYKEKGFLPFGATDGVKAVEIYEKEKPDITLIDVHMPYSPIDGIETLRQIKAINKDAVCVMVTRIDDKKRVEEARELGALHYTIKPLTVAELDETVQDAVNIIKKERS